MRTVRLLLLLFLLPLSTTSFAVDGKRNAHRRITSAALDFLRSDILEVVNDANRAEDYGASFDAPERHFNNCLFRESVAYINHRYRWSVAGLAEKRTRVAAAQLGMALHTAQDFYAHSAWVDPPPIGLGHGGPNSPLIQRGTEPWSLPGAYELLSDDVVVIQGDPPAGTTVDLPRDGGGRPVGATPIVTKEGRRYRGLMTGTIGPVSFATQKCPPEGSDCWDIESVCIRHSEPRNEPDGAEEMLRCITDRGDPEIYENCFQHDDPRRPRFDEAMAAATRQTAHEWCRLVHLARADSSGRAVALLLGLWVKPPGQLDRLATPHPVGTPCAPGEQGSVSISVEPRVPSPDSSDHHVAVLYTSDLRRSARVQFERGQPSGTLALCVAPGETVLLGLWGWKGGKNFGPKSRITLGTVLPPATRSGRC
jgi:hypothetical protein